MWLELVAAALVGVALLWLVFEPAFVTDAGRDAEALVLEGLEDPEPTRSGMALGALKEIEFDRETGKLSDADYEFLKEKYTAEALAALRVEDAAASGDLVPPASGAGAPSCGRCGTPSAPGAAYCGECGHSLAAGASCAACGQPLPPGSQFCGECGGRVAA